MQSMINYEYHFYTPLCCYIVFLVGYYIINSQTLYCKILLYSFLFKDYFVNNQGLYCKNVKISPLCLISLSNSLSGSQSLSLSLSLAAATAIRLLACSARPPACSALRRRRAATLGVGAGRCWSQSLQGHPFGGQLIRWVYFTQSLSAFGFYDWKPIRVNVPRFGCRHSQCRRKPESFSLILCEIVSFVIVM